MKQYIEINYYKKNKKHLYRIKIIQILVLMKMINVLLFFYYYLFLSNSYKILYY